MAAILVDTNVLLDIVTNDASWYGWSQRQLDAAALRGQLLINAVVYAELSGGYDRIEDVDAFLLGTRVAVAPIPLPALFLAGKTYRKYRMGGGRRTGVLSDFFIGAHAASSGLPLLTRDVAHYRSFFPTVELISPAG